MLVLVEIDSSGLKLERIEIIYTLSHFYQLQPTSTNVCQF